MPRIDICNRALVTVGQQPLQAETAPGADVVLEAHDRMVAFLTELRPWSYSIVTVQLGRVDPPAACWWTYAYLLPADRVGSLRTVFDRPRAELAVPGGVPVTEHELQGNLLLTEAERVWLRHQRIPPENMRPPVWSECLNGLLAGECAVIRKEDHTLREARRAEVLGDPRVPGDLGLVGKAANLDKQGQPSPILDPSGGPLLAARSGRGLMLGRHS